MQRRLLLDAMFTTLNNFLVPDHVYLPVEASLKFVV
jgi:hypothetical protein